MLVDNEKTMLSTAMHAAATLAKTQTFIEIYSVLKWNLED